MKTKDIYSLIGYISHLKTEKSANGSEQMEPLKDLKEIRCLKSTIV